MNKATAKVLLELCSVHKDCEHCEKLKRKAKKVLRKK